MKERTGQRKKVASCPKLRCFKWKLLCSQLVLLYHKFELSDGARLQELTKLSTKALKMKVGDGQTSSDSSFALFSYIDEDGDGIIEAQEVRDFVEVVGGVNLDEEAEIAHGVQSAMEHLDIDHDQHLTRSDLAAYWSKLGSLLTVEEVALWVEHAVQLPAEVADIFRQHFVTGFDFPDLVPAKPGSSYSRQGKDATQIQAAAESTSVNNGTAKVTKEQGEIFLDPLQTELGIERENIRKRLRRAIRIRMLGIGSEPEVPVNLTWDSPCAHSIILRWEQPEQGYFPVHKYLLTRKEKDHNGKDTTVVMDGPQLHHTDVGLEPQTVYTYFLQSWNAVGHSPTMIIEAETQPVPSAFAEILLGIAYQNRSTSTKGRPFAFFDAALGMGNIFRMASTVVVLIVAFFGYGSGRRRRRFSRWLPWSSKDSNELDIDSTISNPPGSPQSFYSNFLDENLPIPPPPYPSGSHSAPSSGTSKRPRPPRMPNWARPRNNSVSPVENHRLKSPSPGRTTLLDEDNLYYPHPPHHLRNAHSSPPEMLKRRRPPRLTTRTHSNESVGSGSSSMVSDEPAARPIRLPSPQRCEMEDGCDHYYDDDKCCSVCLKSFSFVKRRFRHHCSRCTAMFCSKDGRTTHSNITPCAIPGTCVCAKCLAR